MKYNLETLFFDLDGVLVETGVIIRKICLDISNNLHLPSPPKRELDKIVGLAPRKIVSTLFAGHQDKANRLYIQLWNQYIGSAQPFKGIRDILYELNKLGLAVGTVTSRNKADASMLLTASGLARHIDDLVTWGHYRAAKPSPTCIIVALRRIKKKANTAAYVGDQPADMIAAKNAGVKAIGATWASNNGALLTEAGADALVSKPEELLELLNR